MSAEKVHRLIKKQMDVSMELKSRAETIPEIPQKIKWKAKFFGKRCMEQYLEEYYRKEAERRNPYYLPYLYMKEHLDCLRRYAKIPGKDISMVLIDGNDGRTDYFLSRLIEEFNDLIIVTERKEYFEGLQERAFQELGLLVQLVRPWEEKTLRGNLLWDFTKELQKPDCYPKDCVCFLPHKKEWKIRELLRSCSMKAGVGLKEVEVRGTVLSPGLAETLLIPSGFPFRESRCEELRKWCQNGKWTVKMKVLKPEKP